MSATKSNRFQNYNMANGNVRPTSSFSSGAWQASNIWSNPASNFAKRDGTTPREANEAIPAAPSGSGALAASSEAEPWVNRNGPWNHAEQPARNDASGSGSPNRPQTASQSIHELANPSFRTVRPTLVQPGGMTRDRQPQQLQAFGPHYAPGLDNGIDRRDSSSSMGSLQYGVDSGLRGFQSERRVQQDSGFPDQINGASREADGTPSSIADPTQQSQGMFGGNTLAHGPFGGHAQVNGHSHRPSIPSSASYPSQAANQRAYKINSHLDEEQFARSLSLEDNREPIRVGPAAGSTYPTASQAFQFNPVSQPWEAGPSNGGRPLSGGYPQDSYGESLSAPYQALSNRSSIADRVPTPAGSFRQLNSPGVFATPPPTAGSWGRPGSSDLRSEITRAAAQHPNPATAAAYYMQPFQDLPYAMNPLYTQYQTPGQVHGSRPVPVHPFPTALTPYGHNHHPTNSRQGSRDLNSEGVRSVLLEEFRNSNKSSRRYELKDIYGHIVEFSGDQHGSRFIQAKLETANSDEKDKVFAEIEPNAMQLMKDVFGNYVIQKFFEHGNQIQKKMLAQKMKNKVCELSVQMYACRVVQKALEHVLVEQQAELVRELEADPLPIIKDANGNHVVQKVLQTVPQEYTGFIPAAFRGEVESLARHQYGCRVLQRVLEFGSDASRNAILEELQQSVPQLMVDQYGNYVVQHVIKNGPAVFRSRIIRITLQNLLYYSKHKYTSNVVEKCIDDGTDEDREEIRQRISRDANELRELLVDSFGNYVIQKILKIEGAEQLAFAVSLKPHLAMVKRTASAKQQALTERISKEVQVIEEVSRKKQAEKEKMEKAPAEKATTTIPARLDSAAPTPVLTREPNTPQSSSPPSTNASAVGEAPEDGDETKTPEHNSAAPYPEVRVHEA